MKLLELFSGTKYVGQVAEQLGYEVTSLDLINADTNCDIMNWNYTVYGSGHFDMIWASPPCTEYSCAKTVGVRNIDKANDIVLRTIAIIEFLNPKYYVIENPQTGKLKDQWMMYGFPYVDVDYCKYGMPYRKRTRLWNNVFELKPRPLCKKDCNSMVGSKHIATAQRGSRKTLYQYNTLSQLHSVPNELIKDIFSYMV